MSDEGGSSALFDAVKKIRQAQAQHEKVKREADEQESNSLGSLQRDGQTRSALTFWFMIGFFGLIAGCFLFTLWYNNVAVGWIAELQKQGLPEEAKKVTLLELDKVLSIVIGALGTSLGFIIGYYFKEKQN
ncbi:hypothetical protein [Mixta calida]|uniref:hypothetical protein n=1 Tax=Mixta calida TaxID=665913 RepID=UPI0011A8BA3C|nr:hypothetical protein [Mixta calida]DAV72801.1 MAG TPA: hypothetical protein [Caudoviricetes sp.]